MAGGSLGGHPAWMFKPVKRMVGPKLDDEIPQENNGDYILGPPVEKLE